MIVLGDESWVETISDVCQPAGLRTGGATELWVVGGRFLSSRGHVLTSFVALRGDLSILIREGCSHFALLSWTSCKAS